MYDSCCRNVLTTRPRDLHLAPAFNLVWSRFAHGPRLRTICIRWRKFSDEAWETYAVDTMDYSRKDRMDWTVSKWKTVVESRECRSLFRYHLRGSVRLPFSGVETALSLPSKMTQSYAGIFNNYTSPFYILVAFLSLSGIVKTFATSLLTSVF